jgi:hypothetical protein
LIGEISPLFLGVTFLSGAYQHHTFIQTKNSKRMKKVLFVLAIGAFASCGSNSTSETKVTDSTTVKTDTSMKADTTMKKTDSASVKTDSTRK